MDRSKVVEAGEWIEWEGGGCPVEPDTLVEAQLRDGCEIDEYANTLDWSHIGFCTDIIAYRVLP